MTVKKTSENPDNMIAKWFEEGVLSFKKPDGVAAVKAFNKVIDSDPAYRHTDGDNPYFYLGKIMEVEGDIEKALVMYTRALAVDQWDEESLIGRGSCYTVLNRQEEAITDFKQVLAIGPKHRRVPAGDIYYVIGENYRKKDNWEKALKWGQKALGEDPQSERFKQLVNEATTRTEK
jgi:tetratricopeptide (TPR) repeat protein